MNTTIILDPTDEREMIRHPLAARKPMHNGTVALLDISKPRGNVLLAQLKMRLEQQLPGVTVRQYAKPTYTKPAPPELRQKIADECGFVIEALAD